MPNVRPCPYDCVEVGRPGEADWRRFHRFLSRGKHPTFIGLNHWNQQSPNGGCFFFLREGNIVAVAMVNVRKSCLTVLNVDRDCRGQGVGEAVLRYLKPNFARVVESAVAWFERMGYKSIGEWKQGRKLRTRVMVRASLISLAGRLRKVWRR